MTVLPRLGADHAAGLLAGAEGWCPGLPNILPAKAWSCSTLGVVQERDVPASCILPPAKFSAQSRPIPEASPASKPSKLSSSPSTDGANRLQMHTLEGLQSTSGMCMFT